MADSKLATANSEIVVGDRFGIDLIAEVQSARSEYLVGDRYGLLLLAETSNGMLREMIVGDDVGRNWTAGMASVVREVLIAEPPFKSATSSIEHLVSMENEPTSVHHKANGYSQAVLMVRPTMALPSTVKSPRFVPSLREQAIVAATRTWARSEEFAMMLRQQAISRRFFSPAPLMKSMIQVTLMKQQVVRSRGKTYVPVSGLFTTAQRQQVVQFREVTPAPDMRTPIEVRGLRQQWIASRARQVVVITTEAHAATLREQVVLADTRPAPHSMIDAGTLVQMTVQRHTVVPPGIDDRVAGEQQQVVQGRAITPPFGDMQAKTIANLSVMSLDTAMRRSITQIAGSVELAVMHRHTYSPGNIIGRHAAKMAQQAVQGYAMPMHHSFTEVGGLSLKFVLARDTPAPWDVIDPAIGRHVFSLSSLSVMRRVVEPPESVNESRWVQGVYSQVVVSDEFPAPDYPPAVIPETYVNQVGQVLVHPDREGWSAVTALTVASVVEVVAVPDNEGWIDATIPQSDVTLRTLYERLVVGDSEFPNSMVSQSAAELAGLVSTVAMGDSSFPNSMVPQSNVEVRHVIEFAALGDTEMPDPAIPSSDVSVRRVAAITVLPDPSLTGKFDGSELRSQNVAEFLVLRDRSLVGIPLRGGPRPLVSVSMT